MRNPTEESSILREAETLCQRAYHSNSGGRFERLVFQRLQKGAQRYGEMDYLSKDNIDEAILEPPDAAAYAILELQRVGPRLSDVDRLELRQFTLAAVAASVNLDVALRRLRHTRDNLLS